MTASLSTDTLTTILTPNGILGYGYEASHFWHAIEHYDPKAIIVDAGSTDPGPCLLGSGATLCSRFSIARDLEPMLRVAFERKIKVLVSSAGGAGTNKQVDDVVSIISEIVEKKHYKLKVATIYSDVPQTTVLKKLKSGLITPCGAGPPPLTENDVGQATNIVAQIGMEPFLRLLKDDSINVIISGRAYDPAPFAAFAVHHGSDAGPAWHMGKIMECGALCALPKGKTIIARVQKDNFILTPMNPIERCTPLSVCAHTTYEKTRPDLLPGPGGLLDLTNAKYQQLEDERSVRVSHAVFCPTPRFQVKLEGAAQLGYRSMFIGGIRDPILIGCIDEFLAKVHAQTTAVCAPELATCPESFKLIFHVYGKNAVMGSLEPETALPHEIGVMGEVLAPTQDKATSIAGYARVGVLHAAYPNQLATAGNLALPLTPLESPIGAVYRFNIYHLMDIDGDQDKMFESKVTELSGSHDSQMTNGHATEEVVPKLEAVTLPPLAKKSGVPTGTCKLHEIASIIRSKNSGPFQITLDVLFDDEEHFDRVKKADILNSTVLAKLYQLEDQSLICTNMFFRPALAWKGTFVRPWQQGSVGERDTFGTQQHAPLLNLVVPP